MGLEKLRAFTLNTQLSDITNQIASLQANGSGSPKGAYATLSALTTAHPTDDGNIYVVTANGHIYDWVVSAWTDTGIVYQSTGITDDSIAINKLNFIKDYDNLFDKNRANLTGYYNEAGTFITSATYGSSDFIRILKNEIFSKQGNFSVSYYDKNKSFLSGVAFPATSPQTVPNNDNIYYMKVVFQQSVIDTFMVTKTSTVPATYITHKFIDEDVLIPQRNIIKDGTMVTRDTIEFYKRYEEGNLFDKTKVNTNGYYNTSGDFVTSSTYYASDFIPVTAGQAYCKTNNTFISFWNASKVFISSLPNPVANPFTVPVGAVYATDTIPVTNLDTYMFVKGSSLPVSYLPYMYTDDALAITSTNIKGGVVAESKLKGKKYNALGDSITLADNNYAYLISQAKGIITFRNYGIGGSTITNISASNPMCIRYSSMDNDADLVTVLGGTNDVSANPPIGTIDSTDDTTFYGALNELFTGLIAKYPNAVICCITMIPRRGVRSNQQPYVDAYRLACNKYSIPYYDAWINSGLYADVVSYTDYLYDGTHPTAKGHQILAKRIGNFLENLF